MFDETIARTELAQNLNELKGALENMTDEDLLEARIKMLNIVEQCIEQSKGRIIMNWRNVFDTSKRIWGDRDKAYQSVKECGYEFFTWNGWVYRITANSYEKTEILVEDIV